MTSTHAKGLLIVSWNANSVFPKRLELLDFITQSSPDLILIQETYLRPHTSFKFPNHLVYRNDRPDRRGGGTAILVKNSHRHTPLPTPLLRSIEATIVQIQTSNSPVVVASIYIPNQTSREDTRHDLEMLLSSTNFPILLAGDFNARHRRWGSRQGNPRGTAVAELLNDLPIQGHFPSDPTCFPSHGLPSTIDFGLSQNITSHMSVSVHDELSSDHSPVFFTVTNTHTISTHKTRKTTNWQKFAKTLQEHPPTLPRIADAASLEAAVSTFTSAITQAIEHSTSTVPNNPNNSFLAPLTSEPSFARKIGSNASIVPFSTPI